MGLLSLAGWRTVVESGRRGVMGLLATPPLGSRISATGMIVTDWVPAPLRSKSTFKIAEGTNRQRKLVLRPGYNTYAQSRNHCGQCKEKPPRHRAASLVLRRKMGKSPKARGADTLLTTVAHIFTGVA